MDDLIARARGVRMASCARHQDREELFCYRARDAEGNPLDPYHLVEMVSALADALEAERKLRAEWEIEAQDLRDRVVQLGQELAKRRPVASAGGSAWLVVRTREQMPAEVWGFRDEPGAEHEARAWFDAVGANWTETFLCQVVAGPGLPQGSVPLHPLTVEAARLRDELTTSRAAHEVTAQERDRAVTELAMMRAWVEQARPVVEAVRDLQTANALREGPTWAAAFHPALLAIINISLPPKEQPCR